MNENEKIFRKPPSIRKLTEVYEAAAKTAGILYPSIHLLRHVSMLRSTGKRLISIGLLMNKHNRLKEFMREIFIDKLRSITGINIGIITESLKQVSAIDFPDIYNEIEFIAATTLKDLPLIIPDLNSELGKAFFEKRMKG